MLDPIAQSLNAVSLRSPYAVPLVFASGAVSSIGPCVAPRFIAIAGIAAGRTRSQVFCLALAFIAGLTATYAAFGAVAPLLRSAGEYSAYTYWIVAAALAAGGFVTLWREQHACTHASERASSASAGGSFLLGASFALVLSPCCTPLVLGILAYASAAGSTLYGSALLATFALGHALPILAVAFGMSGMMRLLERHAVRAAAGVVSAALMFALAGYYAVLA